MRTPLAASLLALAALAACGPNADPGQANAASPAADRVNAAAPDRPASLAAWREAAVRACIEGAREAAAPGVPVEAHCACATDREMAGRTLAELEAAERSGVDNLTPALRHCVARISPDHPLPR